MGYYLVLSDPISEHSTAGYKGLLRGEPCPQEGRDPGPRFMELFYRSVQYLAPPGDRGIRDELSLSELFELAELATRYSGETFEVIYSSETRDCPHDAVLYGLDVTGVGGYSVLGERLVCRGVDPKAEGELFQKLYAFPDKANRYGLLDEEEDAVDLRDSLKQYNRLYPGYIEEEDWKVFYIFKVIREQAGDDRASR